MCLKFAEDLCAMTRKNDIKIEEELTRQFKIDLRNLTNFDMRTLKNLKNLHFNGLLLTKVYIMFQLKKYRGVIFDGT